MTNTYNIMGYVRLRPGGTGREGSSGQLTVPASFMQHLTVGTLFKPEFTDEGILYRFGGEDVDVVPAPTWAGNR